MIFMYVCVFVGFGIGFGFGLGLAVIRCSQCLNLLVSYESYYEVVYYSGTQIVVELRDAGVQCSILTTPAIASPVNISSQSESELSDVEGMKTLDMPVSTSQESTTSS